MELFYVGLTLFLIRFNDSNSKTIPWEKLTKIILQSNAFPCDDWLIRNHALLDHYMQDSNTSWILLWGDEQTEKALKRKHPNLRKLKRSFNSFVNKQKNVYNTICTYNATTIGVGDPNRPSLEATIRVWNTDYESWCEEGPVKQETWDKILVLELIKVKWRDTTTSALIFCIC